MLRQQDELRKVFHNPLLIQDYLHKNHPGYSVQDKELGNLSLLNPNKQSCAEISITRTTVSIFPVPEVTYRTTPQKIGSNLIDILKCDLGGLIFALTLEFHEFQIRQWGPSHLNVKYPHSLNFMQAVDLMHELLDTIIEYDLAVKRLENDVYFRKEVESSLERLKYIDQKDISDAQKLIEQQMQTQKQRGWRKNYLRVLLNQTRSK